MAQEEAVQKELSRRISVRSLRDAGNGDHAGWTVDAEPGELAAIARRLAVPSVSSLHCRFALEAPGPDGVVLARGMLRAVVERVCVVSLDPFAQMVEEQFTLRFVSERGHPGQVEVGSEMLDPDEDDEILYEDGMLDLGEAAVEQLALCLDPYPRRPDLEPDDTIVHDEVAQPGPFAGLARFRTTRH